MALSDAYATAAEYRAAFSVTDTSKDAEILLDLKAVSRHIDVRTGRFFNKDASAVARIYVPPVSGPRLYVDDLASAPTSVLADEDFDGTYETTITGFEAWPLNASKDPEPRPYDSVFLPSWASVRQSFSAGVRYQVTAVYGWPAVPQAVKNAAIQLAGIYRMESPRASNRFDVGVDTALGASREARTIIEQLIEAYAVRRLA